MSEPDQFSSLGQKEKENSQHLPIDFTVIDQSKPLYLALGEENHINTELDELQQHFKILKDLGYSVYATEVLGSDMQPTINGFKGNDRIAEQNLLKHIERTWGYAKADVYVGLIQAALSAQLRIICLDLPHPQQDILREEDHKNNTNSWFVEREKHMEGIISSLLKAPQASGRIVSLTGKNHAKKDSWLINTLEKNQLPVTSVLIHTEPYSTLDKPNQENYMQKSLSPDFDWKIHTGVNYARYYTSHLQ